MSQYDDLLKQLQSDEPFRPQPPMSPDQVTHHAYELETATLKRDSYTSKDLEGFIGFIVSFMTSVIMHTSTPIATRLADGDLIEQRYDTYEQRAEQAGSSVGSGTEELIQTLSTLCASAVDKIVNDPDVELKIRDSFDIIKFAAVIASVYALGRASKDLDTSKQPDHASMLTGIVMTCFKRVPGLLEGGVGAELEEVIKQQLDTLEKLDMTTMVADPEGWIKAFKEANKNV